MLYCQNTPPVGHPTVYPEQEISMDENTTPAEFVKLRDQLALDLGAILNDTSVQDDNRAAEYLLASGLVPLSTIRARYDETHPAPEGDSAEPESKPEAKTWARGEGIEVGAEVEYVGGGEYATPSRIGKRGTVTGFWGDGRRVRGTHEIDSSWTHNLQRIS